MNSIDIIWACQAIYHPGYVFKSLDTLGGVVSIFLVLDSSRRCGLMFGGSTSLVQWTSESKFFAKGLENRHHRKVDNHVVVASYVICFPHGMDLIGSILVFNFQGLSI